MTHNTHIDGIYRILPFIQALCDWSRQRGSLMVGVDVSIRMVEIAQATWCYSGVVRGDLNEALRAFTSTIGEGGGGGDECDTKDDSIGNNGNNRHCNNNEDSSSNNNNNNSSSSSNSINIKSNTNASSKIQLKIPPDSRITPKIPLNLIIAADTFIYIGALGSVFRQISRILEQNGLFLFSIEDLEKSPMRVSDELLLRSHFDDENRGNNENNKNNKNDENDEKTDDNKKNNEGKHCDKKNYHDENDFHWEEPRGAVPGWGGQLLKSARFAHSNQYIESLAQIHGFRILESKSVVLRTEETVPLYGILYVLEVI